MSTDRKYIPVKESRGWYFIEYHPPVINYKFANLHLVITIENASEIDIVDAMEKELKDWLNRYPVPLFVSAFDNSGEIYNLRKIKDCNHLMGFFNKDGEICLYWKLLKDEEIPDIVSNQDYIDDLYSDIAFKTYTELDVDRRKRQQKIQLGWFIFFVWLVMVPLFIEIFGYFSNLLSLIVLIYSFYKALRMGIELIGESKKSKRAKEREAEETLKNHYYYHCKMNPEGFERLKLENFEKMGKDEIKKEAESLNVIKLK
jgi:hypothetical protein